MGFRNSLRAALTRRPPKHVSRQFRSLDGQSLDRLEACLRRWYFGGTSPGYLLSEEGKNELQDHLTHRTNTFRTTVIPWLDKAKPLAGATILEIGCGTGSSTVALAEQGASVIAMDISEGSLEVARERCSLYGLDVDFVHANATEAHRLFSGRHFDFLIFFATLEHMTQDERLAAMASTWRMLSEGDLWCVVDTPNRLWFFDSHTSRLPFFHWLPDDIAFAYSRFSPRTTLSDQYRDKNETEMLHFLRQGRGVSFHEFDLTMGRAKDLRVVSSLALFLRSQNVLRQVAWRLSTESRYAALLASVEPSIHRGLSALPGFDNPEVTPRVRKAGAHGCSRQNTLWRVGGKAMLGKSIDRTPPLWTALDPLLTSTKALLESLVRARRTFAAAASSPPYLASAHCSRSKSSTPIRRSTATIRTRCSVEERGARPSS